MTNRDKIRLADAMTIPYWYSKVYGDALGVPDPFTDANDDYAVLEWMRRGEGDSKTYTLFKMAYCNDYIDGKSRWWLHEVGDYARAALKVIDK